jgi:hypothetical protein
MRAYDTGYVTTYPVSWALVSSERSPKRTTITELSISTELSTAYRGGNFRLETSFRDHARRWSGISEMSGDVVARVSRAGRPGGWARSGRYLGCWSGARGCWEVVGRRGDWLDG